MLCHFTPHPIFGAAAFISVKFFFVLSGFLITSILLAAKDRVDAGAGRAGEMKHFYIRRCLRIFPLYYFVVFLLIMFDVGDARLQVPWLLTYTANIEMKNLGWFFSPFGHFWSLCVEEQFYVFWPLVLFFTPRRWLLPIIVLIASAGPLSRAYLVLRGPSGIATSIFTPCVFDSLAAGALLALFFRRYDLKARKRLIACVLLPIGLTLSILLYSMGRMGHESLYTVLFDIPLGLTFASLICLATFGMSGSIGRFLEWGPITYTGKISYGLYVYHPLVPTLCLAACSALGISCVGEIPKNIWFHFALSFLIAAVSWHWMEKPLNDLKSRFQ